MAVSILLRLAILTVYSFHGTIPFFENVFFPKGWQKNSLIIKVPNMFGSDGLYNGFTDFPHADAMQQAHKMHLNMSLTCPDGTRGRKSGFRDPGQENRSVDSAQ